MSDENIFNEPAPTPAPTIDPPNPPSIPDHLKDLIGEGRKYASVEKALESIPHAQSHIQKIEDDNRKLREEIAKRLAAEEVYEKLTQNIKGGANGEDPPHAPVVDEASIAALVERQIAAREENQKASQNVAKVRDALVAKYGEKAEEVYKNKAQELGVGLNFLNDVIKKSPKVAEELFGLKPKNESVSPTLPASVNTAVLNARPPAEPNAKIAGNTMTDLLAAWRAAKPD